jgi:hypothetical protein
MIKRHPLLPIFAVALLAGACAGMPDIEKPQFTPWHYSFSVLLDPEMPGTSPQLDLAMSLLRMEYPADQSEFFYELMYSGNGLDDYKDRMIREQRSSYRGGAANSADNNWHHTETIRIKKSLQQGIIAERDTSFQSGGKALQTRRYYVLDMEERKQLKIDDLFADYQEQERLRDIVYDEMRKFNNLEKGQPLSSGIFFSDDPELSFNFFVTDDGLGLYWDPEQIARGPVEIIIPWHLVRPMMLHSGMELLTKFDIYLFI